MNLNKLLPKSAPAVDPFANAPHFQLARRRGPLSVLPAIRQRREKGIKAEDFDIFDGKSLRPDIMKEIATKFTRKILIKWFKETIQPKFQAIIQIPLGTPGRGDVFTSTSDKLRTLHKEVSGSGKSSLEELLQHSRSALRKVQAHGPECDSLTVPEKEALGLTERPVEKPQPITVHVEALVGALTAEAKTKTPIAQAQRAIQDSLEILQRFLAVEDQLAEMQESIDQRPNLPSLELSKSALDNLICHWRSNIIPRATTLNDKLTSFAQQFTRIGKQKLPHLRQQINREMPQPMLDFKEAVEILEDLISSLMEHLTKRPALKTSLSDEVGGVEIPVTEKPDLDSLARAIFNIMKEDLPKGYVASANIKDDLTTLRTDPSQISTDAYLQACERLSKASTDAAIRIRVFAASNLFSEAQEQLSKHYDPIFLQIYKDLITQLDALGTISASASAIELTKPAWESPQKLQFGGRRGSRRFSTGADSHAGGVSGDASSVV